MQTLSTAPSTARAASDAPLLADQPRSTLIPSAVQPTIGQKPGEFLSFRLGAEEYGIEILKVQEIRSYEAPTRMAGAPPFVKGVVNLRGVIVPLIDLRLRFGFESIAYNESTVVIVLNVAQRVVGLIVDGVSDVTQLDASQIKAAPSFSSAIDAGHITGIGQVEDRLLILMDVEALVAGCDVGTSG